MEKMGRMERLIWLSVSYHQICYRKWGVKWGVKWVSLVNIGVVMAFYLEYKFL